MGVSLSTGSIIVASLEQIFHKEGLRGICGKAMIGICPFDVSFLTIRLIYCN